MQPFTAQSPLNQLDPKQNGGVLPRNINLKAFDPHRKNFVCVKEATKVPPIDPQADAWYRQAMELTSPGLWDNQKDYPQALKLAQQAVARKHWKALIYVAGLYANGEGVPRNAETAVRLIEQGMQWGVPAAFDLMGTFHDNGTGVKQDASRAYAFWELAADMGNADAQAYLGAKFMATEDRPPEVWANLDTGRAMLECSYAQGNGKGAYELGLEIDAIDARAAPDPTVSRKLYRRALVIFHDGVKFGSEDAASALFVSFDDGSPLVGNIEDTARAKRYSVLNDALYFNPDLRFPNLDKVLPLPPAALPKWDGNKQHLIDAARGIAPAPVPKAAHRNTSMADPAYHIPEGYTLPDKPSLTVESARTTASEAGFWEVVVPPYSDNDSSDAAALRLNTEPPRRYSKGAALASLAALQGQTRTDWHALTAEQLAGVQWRYYGEPVAQSEEVSHYLAQTGFAIEATLPDAGHSQRCAGNLPCPVTGVWRAMLVAPSSSPAFEQSYGHAWLNQSYVEQDQRFPNPQDRGLAIPPEAITWHWLGQANALDASGNACIA